MSDATDDDLSFPELAAGDDLTAQAAREVQAEFVAALSEARARGFSEDEIGVAIGRVRHLPYAVWLEGIRDPRRHRH